ncbi:MAG TPA: DUF4344 domain-containing metallopeptidase [Clostridia bacterium]|nr:DUF4344 domain-containing metallopeptidase [Clostridia bacterium]
MIRGLLNTVGFLVLVSVLAFAESTPSVYIEPSRNLVRDVIQVSAGQAKWYALTLERGSIVYADFKVEGGLNNKAAVWLLDEFNLRQFLAHQQFRYFPGTSGEVRGVGRYTFGVPQSGTYYLVIDNGRAWFMPRNVKVYAYEVLPYQPAELQMAEQQLATFYNVLRSAFVFPDFSISIRHCGMENAFSDPNITMCEELLESLAAQRLEPAITFILFHELGHTLLKQWGLPTWDNEDVADEFATVFMIMAHEQNGAIAAAKFWASSGTRQEALSKLYIDDRHTVSPQRARNILHWLSKQDDLVQRWQKLIIPNMQTEALRQLRQGTSGAFDQRMVEAELRGRGE